MWPVWRKHVAEHLVAQELGEVLKECRGNLAVTVNWCLPQDHRGLLCRAPGVMAREMCPGRTRLALELAVYDRGEEPVMVDKGNHVVVGQEFLCKAGGALMRPIDALKLLVHGLRKE